eukprot:TRINITY_DN223_c0_g1_i1.p2 TRINITY_DN223_c0_g1~~TRINITY_DN223_c0_g1_i1.p2  ORF type:complete len:191 (+),score=36.76 TRINITY_DN223_c0_g1_i1:67-573(+)
MSDTDAKSTALFYFASAVTALIPTYLFYTVKDIALLPAAAAFLTVIGITVWGLTDSYRKATAAQQRKYNALSIPVTAERGGRSRAAVVSQDEQAEKETAFKRLKADASLAYGLFSCNTVYLVTITFCNYVLLKNFEPVVNYVVAGIAAVMVVAVLAEQSKGAKRKRSA